MKEKLFNKRTAEFANATHPKLATAYFSAAGEDIPLKQDWNERWCTLLNTYEDVLDEILSYEIRPDDVFVNTFMKCGTTWMQEAAWLLLNNLDFERAKQTNISKRSPNLDFFQVAVEHEISTMDECRQLASPRLMKSHLPPNLLPKQVWQKKAKIIYVARNLKDCVASAYPFLKTIGIATGNIEAFVDDFMKDEVIYAPYLERLVYYWKMRNEPNIFFVTYEEMTRDLAGVLQKLCKFLNRPELTPEELQQTTDHLSFDKMKNNKQSHIEDYIKKLIPTELMTDSFTFMRRGIVGSYKDEIPDEVQQKLDEHTEDVLSRHGLKEEDIFGII